jgi:hypothetical protein
VHDNYDSDMHPERPGGPSTSDGAASSWALRPWERPRHRVPGPEARRAWAVEPAGQATRALQRVVSDELQEVRAHPSFRQVPDDARVPVSGCPVCGDGALRTVGTIETSIGQLLARACDACGLVDLDPRLDPGLVIVTRQ